MARGGLISAPLPPMKSFLFTLLSWTSTARSAVDINGARVVEPVRENGSSPIEDINTYIPDQYDCPLPCVDYTNAHGWTPYLSVERLERCDQPMLLQMSASYPLDNPETTVLIHSCTLATDESPGQQGMRIAASDAMENPKTSPSLFEQSIHTALACFVDGEESDGALVLTASESATTQVNGTIQLLDGMRQFFEAKGKCDEAFLFAYFEKTVASVYIGAGLGKPTASSVLESIATRVQAKGPTSDRTIAQICGHNSKPETIFGVAIDITGNIAAVQRAAAEWSRGSCVWEGTREFPAETFDITIHSIAHATFAAKDTTVRNGTLSGASKRAHSSASLRRGRSQKRALCSSMRVDSGDGCASLAAKCGIRGADFVKFNPRSDLCSTLMPGDYVCCSAGDPYTPPKSTPPQPGDDGTCDVHLIENGDTCASLAQKYGITVDDIESFNQNNTWAWTECKQMLLGYNMCLSKGSAPLPPPQQGAQCGPLVPGTTWYNISTPMSELNPCPLKACCSNWGFCGPFTAHCDIHAPRNGGPGAKLPGFQNTCVSNCGNEIKQNSGLPASFGRIGY